MYANVLVLAVLAGLVGCAAARPPVQAEPVAVPIPEAAEHVAAAETDVDLEFVNRLTSIGDGGFVTTREELERGEPAGDRKTSEARTPPCAAPAVEVDDSLGSRPSHDGLAPCVVPVPSP